MPRTTGAAPLREGVPDLYPSMKKFSAAFYLILLGLTVLVLGCLGLWLWLGNEIFLYVMIALFAVYLADIAVSVRSAIRMGSRLEKLRAVQEELQQKLEALKEEQARAIEERRQKWESAAEARMAQWEERRQASEQRLRQGLESLGDRGEAYAQHLSRLKAEAQQRMRRLLEDQDFLERRLFRAHPTLRSERYGEAVDRLRDYLDKRKKR